MKRCITKYILYSFLFLLCACTENSTSEQTTYKWVESTLTPTNSMDVYKFHKGEDGQLYLLGWPSDNKSVFAKLVGEQWEIIGEVDEFVIGDFAVFQDTVYFSTSLAVKKCKGTFVDTFINSSTHSSIETFQGQLFIAASHIDYNGGDYSLMRYNTSYELTPVSIEGTAVNLNVANQKLFVRTGAGFLIYDKYGFLEEVPYTGFNQSFLSIDDNEAIYSLKTESSTSIITVLEKKNTEQIGNIISKTLEVPKLEFFENSLILLGQNPQESSISFFLATNNKWESIETQSVVYDIVNYNNRILGGSIGKIVELQEQ